jgi:NTE family protein
LSDAEALESAAVLSLNGAFAPDRWGQRVLLVPGQLVFAVGVLWIVTGAGTTPAYLTVWLPAFLLAGAGVGLTLPALSSAAVAALPPNRFATGGAVNNTARQVGAVLGVAILIAIVGRPGPDAALDAFRHGFLFCAICAITCSATGLALGRVRVRPTVVEAIPGGPVSEPALGPQDTALAG